MELPRAILHIGTMKTGTSTVQATLDHNSEYLLGQNYRYLGWPMRTSERLGRLVQSVRPDRHLIISDEGLWHFCGTKRSDTPRIAQVLEGYRVTIVVYFRRPDEYVESWFSQGLKNGLGSDRVVDFLSSGFVNSQSFGDESGRRFDSEEFVDRIDLSIETKLSYFRQHFPDADILARPFERAQLAGGDIVTDFVDALGPDSSLDAAALERCDDQNVSPDASTVLMVNLLRRGFGVDEDTLQLLLQTHSPPHVRVPVKSRILRLDEVAALNRRMRPVFRRVQSALGGGETDDFFVDWETDRASYTLSPVREAYDHALSRARGET